MGRWCFEISVYCILSNADLHAALLRIERLMKAQPGMPEGRVRDERVAAVETFDSSDCDLAHVQNTDPELPAELAKPRQIGGLQRESVARQALGDLLIEFEDSMQAVLIRNWHEILPQCVDISPREVVAALSCRMPGSA